MGLFDSVYADCPRCGRRVEFQSKADEEPYMNCYTLDDAPTHILVDVMNWPQWCSGCKSWFALVDPDYPPGPPPRPNPQPAPVREPNEGEFSVYQYDPDSLRWWDAPFSFDDLEEPPAASDAPASASPTAASIDARDGGNRSGM